jgi:MoaA/NifB/PqqE/SkfB family radical SAM enzyme
MKINKNIVYLNSSFSNLKFNLKRGKGHLFAYFMDRFRWNIYPRIHHVSSFPTHVDLELSSACNLSCSMCYTTTDEFKKNVSRLMMETKYFKKVIDECASHKSHYSIRLSWRGEPFLHPEIFELIRYAKKKGIKEVSTLTHGGFLNEEKFIELIDAGLDWLTISHDGTGKEYEKIRAPLKYEESLAKIKKYHEIKKERKSVKPVIKIQGIWPAIEKGPEEFYETFSPIVDQVIASPLLDFLRVDTDREYIEDFTCPVLYQRLTIGSTGEAYLCVNDEMGSVVVGDVKKESVEEIWKGGKLQKAREIHLKHLGVKELSPCKYCMYPRKTQKDSGKIGSKKLKIDNYTNRSQVPGR